MAPVAKPQCKVINNKNKPVIIQKMPLNWPLVRVPNQSPVI